MSAHALFTILHLSDFHFSKRRIREQGIVVDALLHDLESLCVGHRKPDLVMFTGDLVHAAGTDLHDEAYDFLIDRVSKVTGCSDERIFIAPGNHDLAWPGLEAFGDDTRYWRSLIGKSDEVARFNELYMSRAFDAAVQAKFEKYLDLEKYIRGGNRGSTRRFSNVFVTVDFIEKLNVDIVTFNTAVLSTGGNKLFERDERNLVLPEYAVMEAISALTPNSFRIFVTHHPISWLSEQSAKYVEGEITRHAHIHLFGHMHDPQPKNIVGLRGEVIADQSGATFSSRKDYYNGYTLITIDRSHNYAEAMLRSYFKERSEFDDGIDIISDGRWWSSQGARQHFRKIATPVDPDELRAHLAGPALAALQRREAAEGGEGDLYRRFVCPPLRRTFVHDTPSEEGKIDIETPVDLSAVVSGDTNLIVYARAEYGRTTLLRVIRHDLLSGAENISFPRLPILIDFESITANVDNLLRYVKAGSELAPDDNSVESLLSLGHACVLIDDVHFDDRRRMRILREFVTRFPKARYVLSSPLSSAIKLGACIDPEMPVRFEFVEIRELRRKDMRQLLAREERCTDVEVWLDRLQQELREINLPFTAANGSIFIEILSERYNFTPINRAVLMEQFVDSTLRKAAIEQSHRETFDYTNKTDLLSYIAAWMAMEDQYIPSKEAVRVQMGAYVDSRGLNVDLDSLLSEFLAARILVKRPEGRLSFRYRAVLEYFIALRMTADPGFKAWVMDEERYLRYVNEIQYYAGKLRNDAAMVDLVAGRHQQILSEALSDIGEIDLFQFDTLQLPSDEDGDAVDSTAHEIASPPLTQAEKDAELETDLPTDAEDRQEVFRPKAVEVSSRVLLSLILYSGLVKNMELIADSDKRRHLSSVWKGWAILLITALRVAPRLANERRMRINGALYEVQAPQGMATTTLLRQLMLQLPHIHIHLLSSAVGTEKLERQLTEPTLEEQNEPKIYSFLRAGVIADLRLAAMPSVIRELALKLKDNRYLLWSLIVHLNYLRRLDRIKEDHFRLLQEPLAGAIANLRGGSQEVRRSEKTKQIVRLKRDRLLLELKRERDS